MRTEINNKYFIKRSLTVIMKLALILTCVAPISSLAEEEQSLAETNSNTSVQAEEQSQITKPKNKPAPQQQSTKKVKSPSRFKPSEEISEDYSVPFPVDI